PELAAHAHEGPASMALPLILLAIGSTVVGFLGIPGNSRFEAWLAPVFHGHAHEHGSEATLIALAALLAAVIGWFAARQLFAKGAQPQPANPDAGVFGTLKHAYYVDDIYRNGVVRPLLQFSKGPLEKG